MFQNIIDSVTSLGGSPAHAEPQAPQLQPQVVPAHYQPRSINRRPSQVMILNWPNKLTSNAIPNAVDWADELVLDYNEAVRRELKAIKLVQMGLRQGEEWRLKAFCRWWNDFFHPFVEIGLDTHANVLYTALEQRGQDMSHLRASAQQLEHLLDEISTYPTAANTAAGQDRFMLGELLLQKVRNVTQLLEQHYSNEELEVIDKLRQCVPREDAAKLFKDMFGEMTLGDIRICLPPLQNACNDWMLPRTLEAFNKRVPWSGYMLGNVYRNMYDKEREALMKVASNAPPKPFLCG